MLIEHFLQEESNDNSSVRPQGKSTPITFQILDSSNILRLGSTFVFMSLLPIKKQSDPISECDLHFCMIFHDVSER